MPDNYASRANYATTSNYATRSNYVTAANGSTKSNYATKAKDANVTNNSISSSYANAAIYSINAGYANIAQSVSAAHAKNSNVLSYASSAGVAQNSSYVGVLPNPATDGKWWKENPSTYGYPMDKYGWFNTGLPAEKASQVYEASYALNAERLYAGWIEKNGQIIYQTGAILKKDFNDGQYVQILKKYPPVSYATTAEKMRDAYASGDLGNWCYGFTTGYWQEWIESPTGGFVLIYPVYQPIVSIADRLETCSKVNVAERANGTWNTSSQNASYSSNIGYANIVEFTTGNIPPTPNYSTQATCPNYATTARYASNAALAGGILSDYRLKTNLEPLQDAEQRVNQINAYRFNWTTNPTGQKVDGFIAHEISQIVPEAVIGEKDAVDENVNPVYQTVDYSKAIPILICARQEIINRTNILQDKLSLTEIKNLEIKISNLEFKIKKLLSTY